VQGFHRTLRGQQIAKTPFRRPSRGFEDESRPRR
jgi:hypothetical protein